MAIKPDNFTCDQLLNSRLFRIPEYQRAYSWKRKQREDLFNDIDKVKKKEGDRHHFMATIVCLKEKRVEEVGTEEFGVYEIVDGQQRLTSLIVLLKAISKDLEGGDDLAQHESKRVKELLVKRDDRLILLQTNHDSSFIFRNYIKEGVIPNINDIKTIAEKNLHDAFIESEKFVSNSGDPLELLKLVKNRLDFIFYVIEDQVAVYTTFEVLNSRGLDVDWLDKCKSILMGIAFEKLPIDARQENINEVHKIWTNIYKLIGIRNISGDEILRFTYVLNTKKPQSKLPAVEKAIEFFRKYCHENPTKILDVSLKFKDLISKLEELDGNYKLKAVLRISQARLLAVAILLRPNLSENDRKIILKKWENVTFKIYGLARKDARTKVGDYVKAAHQIFNDLDLEPDKILSLISKIGLTYQGQDAASELIGEDCYNNWTEDLRYFLFHYEEELSKRNGVKLSEEVWSQVWLESPSKTIEHILPQEVTESWANKFKTKENAEKFIHRLGNLMILPPGINSSAKNKLFNIKKEIYSKNLSLHLVREVAELKDWDQKALEEREMRLVDWAKEYWK